MAWASATRSTYRVVGEAVAACVKGRLSGAEGLQEALPGLQVHDRNACSGCRAIPNTALHRFARQKLLKPLHVIVGSEGDAPQVEGTVIVVGDCAKDCSHLGTMIAGCPAPVPAIIEALQGSGAVCQRCLELGRQALAGLRSGQYLLSAGERGGRSGVRGG